MFFPLPFLVWLLPLLLTRSPPVCAAAAATTLIGINLGPTYLTSAFTRDPSGADAKYTTLSIKGSAAYRNYLASVLTTQAAGADSGSNPHHQHDDVAARAIFHDALATLLTATAKRVSDLNSNSSGGGAAPTTINIGVISQPLYFNTTTAAALADAARSVAQLQFQHAGGSDPSQGQGQGQLTRFTNAARVAYGLDSCAGFGMNASGCDIDEGEHSVVVVDYNAVYLELAIGYVRGAEVCSVRGYKRVEGLGEEGAGLAGYGEALRGALREFRGAYFATFDFWDYGAHVRGVVLAGDASREGMDVVRAAVREVWPEQCEARLRDEMEPMGVAAVGAARLAGLQARERAKAEEKRRRDREDKERDEEGDEDEDEDEDQRGYRHREL